MRTTDILIGTQMVTLIITSMISWLMRFGEHLIILYIALRRYIEVVTYLDDFIGSYYLLEVNIKEKFISKFKNSIERSNKRTLQQEKEHFSFDCTVWSLSTKSFGFPDCNLIVPSHGYIWDNQMISLKHINILETTGEPQI